ncbi:hypothetical protein BD410DRAFT_898872 [Rickenella mellea]|uniref:Uncharacterized protein n=1 Tax=Rickenella mellea TaxID=50990 RepID=A0A4Y7Q1L9_9AGAM|nr:hypothetical protein BD410DRAFT_898872 [Rickenella mellea]
MDGVEDLLGLLECVKSRGWEGAFDEDVKYGPGRAGRDFQSYAEPLRSLRQNLDDAKRCMAAVNRIKKQLGRKIRNLQKLCVPLVLEDGIRRLPDEILALIFELDRLTKFPTYPQDTIYSPLPISHVSHRFRQLSLTIPLLWTKLSITHPDALLRAFIARSGDHDLEISFEGSAWNDAEEESFLELVQLSSRWSILNGATKYLIQFAGITCLPRLWRLVEPSDIELSKPMMPSLSQIDGWGLDFTIQPSMMAQITSLHLHFTELQCLDVGIFARTVYAMTSLRNLHLKIHYSANNGSEAPLKASEILKPHSFHIDSLSRSLLDIFTPEAVIKPLYDCLTYFIPSTVFMCLTNILAEEPLHTFFYDSNRQLFPYASTIRIVVQQECHIFYVLAEVLKHCDIARSVHIEAPASPFPHGLFPPYNWPQVSSIPIRNLCFQNCDMFTEDDVESLAKYFLSAEEGQGLQTLEIRSCMKITEELFFNVVMRSSRKSSGTFDF